MVNDALAVAATGITTDIGVAVLAGVDFDACAAFTIASESVPIMISSKEASLIGWEIRACWPAIAGYCRALQARMPSYHV